MTTGELLPQAVTVLKFYSKCGYAHVPVDLFREELGVSMEKVKAICHTLKRTGLVEKVEWGEIYITIPKATKLQLPSPVQDTSQPSPQETL